MFRKMADYLDRNGYGRNLKYFSRSHLNVEIDHGLFDVQAEATLSAIVLPPEAYAKGLRLVDRGFAAMTKLFDGFEQRISEQRGDASSKSRSPAV
jgi:hypothetical protein